ncbi:MAG: DNA polymerase III subunit gamma/tau [Alphaproteobacteria bacterium]|nr:DNA polymerase III subunit gamma/tau [Alphaproteobacteria bacterium]
MSIAYRVLARQYRPKILSELIGQDVLVRILTNAFTANRIPHAIMMSGTRGVGKTTTARLLARALNCVGADGKGEPTLNPCNVCDACQKLLNGNHIDVLEMDAASRTGVDDIRDIIEGVKYKPVSSRYKIYIIDEVHMLSKSAFNALLKTLEEPPPHAKFIFATTEIRRVPITILSRCMRFDLRMVDAITLSAYLQKIAFQENIQLDDKTALLLAQAAQGSVRDGLSLLDQAIVYAQDAISFDQVKQMLGLLDRSLLYKLLAAIFEGNPQEALLLSQKAYQEGADPLHILHDLQAILYILSRALIDPTYLQSPNVLEFDRVNGLELLPNIDMPILIRAWQMTQKGIEELAYAFDAYQSLELILIRLTYVADLPTPNELVQMMQSIPDGSSTDSVQPVDNKLKQNSPQTAQPETFQEIVTLCHEQREMILAMQLSDQIIPIESSFGFLKISLKDTAPKDLTIKLQNFLAEKTGTQWQIDIVAGQSGKTIYELDQRRKEKELNDIKAIPIIAKTLEIFKDATISKIETIDEQKDI